MEGCQRKQVKELLSDDRMFKFHKYHTQVGIVFCQRNPISFYKPLVFPCSKRWKMNTWERGKWTKQGKPDMTRSTRQSKVQGVSPPGHAFRDGLDVFHHSPLHTTHIVSSRLSASTV